MTPGTLFKKLRLARGLTLTAVAQTALLSRSSVQYFEHDRCHPRIHDLISLCQAINVKPLAFIRLAYIEGYAFTETEKMAVLLKASIQKTES